MIAPLSNFAEEVAQTFNVGTPVAEMTVAGRGEEGQIWRLQTHRGIYAVKELLSRQTEPRAATDVAFQEAVLAAGTVTLPAPLRTGSGSVLASVAQHQVRAYEWVDLLPVDRAVDSALLGATVAAVHRVPAGPGGPLRRWDREPVGKARWQELHRDAVASNAPFADAFAEEIPVLLQLESLLQPPRGPLRACHRDLWADNVLPLTGGGLCVLDWEDSGQADPAQELPMVLFDFAFEDSERIREVYGAYVDAGGPARLQDRSAFTMLIAIFGHVWELAVHAYITSGAGDASASVRAHSIKQVEELLSPALRLHHLDDMLDAVSGLGTGM